MSEDPRDRDYNGRAAVRDAPKVVAHSRKVETSETIDSTSEDAQKSYRQELGSRGSDSKSDSRYRSRSYAGSIKTMLSFFTIFRIDVSERDIASMERNFSLAPVIGFIMGLIAAAVGFIFFELGLGSLVSASLVLASLFIVTKFLHFDGLTDFGDGMVATGDQEKHIRALKDTNIGAGGFGIAFIVTLISFSCLGSAGALIGLLIWPTEIFMKNAMVAAATYGEPGDGMAANQVRNTTQTSLVESTVISVVLAVIASAIAGLVIWGITGADTFTSENIGAMAAVLATGLVMSFIVGLLMAQVANRTFGRVNGDILGATNEIARAVILVSSLVVLGLF